MQLVPRPALYTIYQVHVQNIKNLFLTNNSQIQEYAWRGMGWYLTFVDAFVWRPHKLNIQFPVLKSKIKNICYS